MSERNVVLVTGAGGWLGSLLVNALLDDPKTPNVQLVLIDIVEPKAPAGANAITIKADLTDPSQVDGIFQTSHGIPDTVYCLHGIMSRGAEDNFDFGLKVNVDSVRLVLNAARRFGSDIGRPLKFIFTSSLAVYGGPLPEVIKPDTIATPQGSYGAGKLLSEILINEYTRRGFVDGRIIRLPTIVVRPGAPSAATSSFLSAIIREPLKGIETTCFIGNSLSSPELDLGLGREPRNHDQELHHREARPRRRLRAAHARGVRAGVHRDGARGARGARAGWGQGGGGAGEVPGRRDEPADREQLAGAVR